jgi:hypothetical protein
MLACVSIAQTQSVAMPEKTRDNLMLVVRETVGANKQDEVLTPTGKVWPRLARAFAIVDQCLTRKVLLAYTLGK